MSRKMVSWVLFVLLLFILGVVGFGLLVAGHAPAFPNEVAVRQEAPSFTQYAPFVAAGFFVLSALGVGFFYPRRWAAAALISWLFLLFMIRFTLIVGANEGPDGIVAMWRLHWVDLWPILVACGGGYVGARLRRINEGRRSRVT